MFKLDRKSLIAVSLAAAVSVGSACFSSDSSVASNTYKDGMNPGKLVIDGGITYPIKNNKTGVYGINSDTQKGGYSYGRTPTKNELEAWSRSVTPHTPPPEGHGTVTEGSDLYDAKCGMCHGDFGAGGAGYPALAKGNAYANMKTLKNQRINDTADGPVRVFGNYWPEASTLWWYIKEGMPHPAPKSLTDDQVYALVAYILSVNEMKIDGVLVEGDYDLDRAKFMKIQMPNKNGFLPKIDGKNGLENTRKFFSVPKNIGAVTSKNRCMKNCIKGENKVTRITIETKDFLPPLSQVRDLPAAKEVSAADAAKATYEETCKMCHGQDGMGAPVVGNQAAWAKVAAQGMDTVYSHAINGFNGMPPKGGTDLADEKIKAVVDFMINLSK
jgi:cytochrome c